jgi:hypothetical protein
MKIRWARTAALSLFSALLWSGAASADVEREARTSSGDYFEFKDDPLHKLANGPQGSDIRVRPPAQRVYLIRPRAHFVPEMLKSVEHI